MTSRHEPGTDSPEHRICPYCAESIQRQAKVCPRCRQWLTLRSLRNPAVATWAYGFPHLVVYVVVGMFLLVKLSRLYDPKPDYTAFLNSVQVLDARMHWVQSSNGPRIYFTGILTNRSDLPWRDVELECRFFNPRGQLADAVHPHAGLTIQPHADAAFRVTLTPAAATNDYTSFGVSVSTARNTKGLY